MKFIQSFSKKKVYFHIMIMDWERRAPARTHTALFAPLPNGNSDDSASFGHEGDVLTFMLATRTVANTGQVLAWSIFELCERRVHIA